MAFFVANMILMSLPMQIWTIVHALFNLILAILPKITDLSTLFYTTDMKCMFYFNVLFTFIRTEITGLLTLMLF